MEIVTRVYKVMLPLHNCSSSESVMPGHPDKLADQISDGILDLYIATDSHARVAIETLVTGKSVIVAGEVSSSVVMPKAKLIDVVRDIIKDVGYIGGDFNFSDADIDIKIGEQSSELTSIIQDSSRRIRNAGDQSVVFGYAVNENDSYIPSAAYYANWILQDIYSDVRAGKLPKLGPDGKVLVKVRYADGMPVGIDMIVLSLQHERDADINTINTVLFNYLRERLPKITQDCFLFNKSGTFYKGGPSADAGLTGRKIVVDAYGAGVPVGGGAFSGKDGSKIDRSGAYIARFMAKNVVASGLAERCLIKLAYCIGMPDPISFELTTFGTNRVEEKRIIEALRSLVDLTPGGIFDRLDLGLPIYKSTASFGHFGRIGYTWEELNLVEALLDALEMVA